MKPVVDRLRGEYEGTVRFVIWDIDESKEGAALMRSLGARYLPTIVLFNSDGSEAGRLVGVVPEGQLRQEIDALE